MIDIDQIDIRRLDMTLLLVFAELIEQGRLTRVAATLGLTQSAVSHALGRLRRATGDPLFLRRPHGMVPTEHAERLAPIVREILGLTREALALNRGFDPATAEADLRIGATDALLDAVTGPLIARLRRSAPGVRIALASVSRHDGPAALREGRLDAVLGFLPNLGPEYRVQPLFEDGYRVVAAARAPRDLDAYLAADHLVVSPGGDLGGIVDTTLARSGRARSVVVAVPQFLPALDILARTGLVATLPARFAEAQAHRFGLDLAPVPFALRPYRCDLVAHRRTDASAIGAYVRGLITEIAAPGPDAGAP